MLPDCEWFLLPRGMNPMYKWVGGKKHLLPTLRQHLNRWLACYAPQGQVREDFEFDYVEPFLGGGAFALDLMDTKRIRFFLSDINSELINVWTQVRDANDALVAYLRRMERGYNNPNGAPPANQMTEALVAWHAQHDPVKRERSYYEARALWNDIGYPQPLHWRAGNFLFLNKTCFNGLYRVNSKGLLNSPWGKVEHVNFDFENLKAVGRALRSDRVHVTHASWEAAINQLGASPTPTFIYCDPPYDVSEDKPGFTAYDKSGFGRPEQKWLEARMRELAHAGDGVMLSNADTPYIRSLYPATHGWKLHEVSRPGTVSSKAGGRERVGELLITSF